ncbi:uncharacterized protein SOCEGT47_010240 [Sorangium cellulosum]|uniref:Uncharacterized protein n=1 Tax=Sorangium cellulosum TaxID=56 RepID=A0A4V0NCW1_SORCE|nr:hypothetical protein [Sorangium cellulosum]AUX20552.1 uncharacterized protein SOCEGT47_010240 [Sorangium cellulosum]
MSNEPTISQILGRGPEAIATWIELILEGREPRPDGVDWPVLAQLAASDAISRGPSRDGLEWAKVAIAIYENMERLFDRAADDSDERRVMNLRSFFIKTLGPRRGDPLLDPDLLIAWFRRTVHTSPEDAAARAERCRDMMQRAPADAARDESWLSEMRELRRIKNVLSVLEPMTSRSDVQLDEDILEWLRARPRLP